VIPSGTNLPKVGDFNQIVVLEAIRRVPDGLSRVELASDTGLSSQTITNIAKKLLASGLIAEVGRETVGPGKPRTILQLKRNARYAVGIHIDPTTTTVVVMNWCGDVTARERITTPLSHDPGLVVSRVTDLVDGVISASNAPKGAIIGLGVAAPGPINAAEGTVVHPPNLRGWEDVHLRDALRESTGLETVMSKDAIASMVAERWLARNLTGRTAIFIYLGSGVGAGLMANGEVIRGSTLNAGECGDLLVGQPTQDGSSVVGYFGRECQPLALASKAIAAGLVPSEVGTLLDRSSEATDSTQPPLDPIDLALSCLTASAARGEAKALDILRRGSEATAQAIATISDLVDADQVIVGGPYWHHLEAWYMRWLAADVNSFAGLAPLRQVLVRGSAVGTDVGAVGAATLAFDEMFSPRASTLFLNA
jgi:predicted NBD/HSP70 family sugar kinase